MNWKRGFRRIAFVIATFIAFITAGLTILFILAVYNDAKGLLTMTSYNYHDKYGYVGFLEKDELISLVPVNPTKSKTNLYKNRLEKKYTELGNKLELSNEEMFEQMPALKTLLDLEDGFWVNLSTIGLVGICSAAGLFGGISGFLIVWVLYKLLEWLVLGFCDNNRLHSERT
jgi:hypothetical protein